MARDKKRWKMEIINSLGEALSEMLVGLIVLIFGLLIAFLLDYFGVISDLPFEVYMLLGGIVLGFIVMIVFVVSEVIRENKKNKPAKFDYNQVEPMKDFFAKRINSYDMHMLKEVEGMKEAYYEISKYVYKDAKNILDLGCGTGLELQAIFAKAPDVHLTGIDLCHEMLDKLKLKYSNYNLNLICDDYLQTSFGINCYDCVLSVQTMHHLTEEEKQQIYQKIYLALERDSFYIECDYMVLTEEEMQAFIEKANDTMKIINQNEKWHIDRPLTIQKQINLLYQAGFVEVNQVFRKGSTTILIAKK